MLRANNIIIIKICDNVTNSYQLYEPQVSAPSQNYNPQSPWEKPWQLNKILNWFKVAVQPLLYIVIVVWNEKHI